MDSQENAAPFERADPKFIRSGKRKNAVIIPGSSKSFKSFGSSSNTIEDCGKPSIQEIDFTKTETWEVTHPQ